MKSREFGWSLWQHSRWNWVLKAENKSVTVDFFSLLISRKLILGRNETWTRYTAHLRLLSFSHRIFMGHIMKSCEFGWNLTQHRRMEFGSQGQKQISYLWHFFFVFSFQTWTNIKYTACLRLLSFSHRNIHGPYNGVMWVWMKPSTASHMELALKDTRAKSHEIPYLLWHLMCIQNEQDSDLVRQSSIYILLFLCSKISAAVWTIFLAVYFFTIAHIANANILVNVCLLDYLFVCWCVFFWFFFCIFLSGLDLKLVTF